MARSLIFVARSAPDRHAESLARCTFYVAEHNGRIPHAAFAGQTPDEMYFQTGAAVPDTLAVGRAAARAARIAENRARSCSVCA